MWGIFWFLRDLYILIVNKIWIYYWYKDDVIWSVFLVKVL